MDKILVVLPSLGDRIESLTETLQTVAEQRKSVNLNIVLVLPESATEARDLGQKYGANIVNDPCKGLSAAINVGIQSRVDETLYAWIGDDDLFRPNGLATLLELFNTNDDVVVAYGGCEYIDPDGNVIATSAAGRAAQFILSWGPDLIPHPGSLISIDALSKIGNFDSSLKYAMDLDVFLKLRKVGRFVSTKKVVSAFRWHPDSLTVSNRFASSRESEMVKRNHLPSLLKPLSYIWTYPLRWAASSASTALNRRAKRQR
jgi:glycosyltransferase involved in cell wall biosynthesis